MKGKIRKIEDRVKILIDPLMRKKNEKKQKKEASNLSIFV